MMNLSMKLHDVIMSIVKLTGATGGWARLVELAIYLGIMVALLLVIAAISDIIEANKARLERKRLASRFGYVREPAKPFCVPTVLPDPYRRPDGERILLPFEKGVSRS